MLRCIDKVRGMCRAEQVYSSLELFYSIKQHKLSMSNENDDFHMDAVYFVQF